MHAQLQPTNIYVLSINQPDMRLLSKIQKYFVLPNNNVSFLGRKFSNNFKVKFY